MLNSALAMYKKSKWFQVQEELRDLKVAFIPG